MGVLLTALADLLCALVGLSLILRNYIVRPRTSGWSFSSLLFSRKLTVDLQVL
jgi:hypothetical protein